MFRDGQRAITSLSESLLFHPPTEGSVVFDGEPIAGLPPHAVTRRGIGRTFQNVRLFAGMTVAENVMVGRHCRTRAGVWRGVLRTRGKREEERGTRERTRELLDLVGLSGAASRQAAGSLPYGHQRRLEIARALAAEPRLLLLDEPAAGMNEAETGEVFGLIRRLRELGVTILLIEHDMSLVMKACDRFAQGRYPASRSDPDEHRPQVGVGLGVDEGNLDSVVSSGG